jgi:hypothetical protein
MRDSNRHERRRGTKLRRQGYTDDEIREIPDRQGGDPLLDANAARAYVGNISAMTLWRWTQVFDFPAPDLTIARRKFWRRSTLETWLDLMTAAKAEQRLPTRRRAGAKTLQPRRSP